MEVGGQRTSTQDVAWGPLVFEARRFVELRKKSLWQQFMSADSFGMGLFYTLNVSVTSLLCCVVLLGCTILYCLTHDSRCLRILWCKSHMLRSDSCVESVSIWAVKPYAERAVVASHSDM